METHGGFYLSQVKQLQERIFDRLLNKHGIEINGAQGRILFVLWKEDFLTMSEISQRTSLANNTLSSVMDRMAERGLVTRERNPDSRREVLISLTEQARQLEQAYREVSDEMADIFYEGFSRAEVEAFEKDLRRILQNLQKSF